MRRLRVGLLTLMGSALAACGGGGPDEPSGPSFSTLLIGGGPLDGSAEYVELTDGQDVTLVPGAQGGFHVYVNVRVEEESMTADHALYLHRTARREDTGQLVSTTTQLSTFETSSEAAGYYQTERSMLLFLCPAPVGIPVFDHTLVVRVEALLDHKDEQPIATGTMRLTPRCPEVQQRDFCLSICSGN